MAYAREVSSILAIEIVSVAVFTGITLSKPKLASKISRQWIAVHGLPFLCNLSAIVCTTAQLFLFNRTESECFVLHHVAANCFWFAELTMRTYFMLRVIMIHGGASPAAQRIDFVIFGVVSIDILIMLIWVNFAMTTFVVPGIDVCSATFVEEFALLMVIQPTVLDVIINWRLLTYIFAGSKTAHNNQLHKGIGRLIRITAGFILVQSVFSLLCGLVLFGVIPVQPGFQTVALSAQMAASAGTTIWPSIIVFCLKLRSTTTSSNSGTLSSGLKGTRTNLTTSANLTTSTPQV